MEKKSHLNNQNPPQAPTSDFKIKEEQKPSPNVQISASDAQTIITPSLAEIQVPPPPPEEASTVVLPSPILSSGQEKTVLTPPPLSLSTRNQISEQWKKVHSSATIVTSPPKKMMATVPLKKEKTISHSISVIYELFTKNILSSSLKLGKSNKETNAPTLLRERYSFVKEIAHGGMGFVELIRDNDLNRYLARKCILPEFQKQKEILERFAEEAQMTGQLEHPNIIPIHDIGLDPQGQIYFTMKYIKGKTLEEVLNELRELKEEIASETYSLTQLLQIFQQIGNAIRFAHSQGVIHRDLKPANIMLGAFGEVIVMDWGLAKVLGKTESSTDHVETIRQQQGNHTMIGSVVGTPAYMPPEQALGQVDQLDERSDVYSLGAILFEILTLSPPFGMKGDIRTTLQQVVTDNVPTPDSVASSRNREVPKELGAIALKALNKDKNDRYASVTDLLKDVQYFLEGKEVSALPDNFWRKCQRKARRHASTIKWSAFFVSILVLSLVFGWQYYRNSIIKTYLQDGDHLRQEIDTFKSNLLKKQNEAKTNAKNLKKPSPYALVENQEQLITLYLDFKSNYRKILDFDSSHLLAKKKLVWANMELWKIGLEQKNVSLMQTAREEIQYHLGEKHFQDSSEKERMDGLQTLTVLTETPSTECYLFQYIENEGVLLPIPYTLTKKHHTDKTWLNRWKTGEVVPQAPFVESVYPLPLTPENFWGKTDAKGHLEIPKLEPGSYLAVLNHPDFSRLRVPFLVRHPELLIQKTKPQIAVRLLPKDREVPHFTYIPKTHFFYGGSESAGASVGGWRDDGEFFIKTEEVTQGEYVEFLENLCQSRKFEEVEKRIPRSFHENWKLVTFIYEDHRSNEEGKHLKYNQKLIDLAKKWNKPWKEWKKDAVSGISYDDAQAYLAWLSNKEQRAYRLPTEQEWELAARGADGRKYSWGSHFQPGYAKLTQGYGNIGSQDLDQLDSSEFKDESPFGVRHLAGNVAEWVDGFFDPSNEKKSTEGPSEQKESLEEVLRIIRGNAWGLTPIGLECAFRTNGPEQYYHRTIGFRYCFSR